MKTAELTEAALDWAVAKAKGITVFTSKQGKLMTSNYGDFNPRQGAPWWCPSTNWAQGGAIIERESIFVLRMEDVSSRALKVGDCGPQLQAQVKQLG
jgi:hypothetical protein